MVWKLQKLTGQQPVCFQPATQAEPVSMLPSLDRRRFLLHSGFVSTQYSLLISTALALATPMASAETPEAALAFSTLQAHEAACLESIAGRILPEDESGPGAIKGGVIYFIDKVLGSSRQEWLGLLRDGLLELDAQAMSAHGSASFALLESAKQDELLRAIEQTTFFDTMRMLTMAGMFALPEYGGNRDHAGWQLIGFGHHQVWQPPFGHYDADYIARGE